MSKNPKSKPEMPVEAEAAQTAPAEKLAPKGITMFEKVKLMGDLAGAIQNDNVINTLKTLPNGERIYMIFVEAIEKELSNVMSGGQKEELPKEVMNLVTTTQAVGQTIHDFNAIIQAFLSSPLVQILEMMNHRLGGDSPSKGNAPQRKPVMQYSDEESSSHPQTEGGRSARSALGLF